MRLILVGIAVLMGTTVGARDLVWKGSSSNYKWDVSNANWVESSGTTGTLIPFASGDNAIFDGSLWAFNKAQWVCNAANPVTVPLMLVTNDTSQTFVWTFSARFDQSHGNIGRLEKWGPGTMEICDKTSEWSGDLICYGGTVKAKTGSGYQGDYRGGLGSNHNQRDLLFREGTVLDFASAYVLGGEGSGNGPMLIISNATFRISSTGRQNIFAATYYNATFDIATADDPLYFTRNQDFKGTTPMTLSGRPVVFGRGKSAVTISVADVTHDDTVDLTLGCRLVDQPVTYAEDKIFAGQCLFTKAGAGTMALTAKWSATTNNITVSAGTLQLDADANELGGVETAIGNINPQFGRKVTVGSGATLRLEQKIGVLNVPRNWTLLVDHGTLSVKDEVFPVFGELDFNDATVDFGYPPNAWLSYGLFGVTGKFTLRGGTPYVFNPPAVNPDEAFVNIGFKSGDPVDDTDVPGHPGFTNMWSVLELNVADITGNDAADATFGLKLRDMQNMTYHTESDYRSTGGWGTGNPYEKIAFRGGIKKTGTGTFRTTAQNAYTHTTEVAEGAFVADGSIARSSGVTVKAGAYLGGTGTVCAVTLEANGGFLFDATKTDGALKVPSLATAGAVKVKVVGATSAASLRGRTLLTFTGTKPTSLDLSGWSVDLTGTGGSQGLKLLAYDAENGRIFFRSGFLTIVK